jgi:hypothetical protein
MANVVIGQSIVLPCIALTRATFLPDEATACVAGVQLDLSGDAAHGYWWDDTATDWAAAVPANADLPAATLIAGTDGARNITLPASAGTGKLGGRMHVMFVRDAVATPTLMGAAYGSAYITSENVGARTITLQLRDGATPPTGASVDIYNASDDWVRRLDDSNDDGDVIAYLDDGDYYARSAAAFWTQTTKPLPFTVSADASVAVAGTLWSAPAPSSADMCVIYGDLKSIAGIASEGDAVTIMASLAGNAQGNVMTMPVATGYALASGYVSVEVVRNAAAIVNIPTAGWHNEARTVPNAASQDLATWTS